MKIEDDVESGPAQSLPKRNVGGESPQPFLASRDNHLVEIRIRAHNWRGGRFDEIRDVSAREPLTEGADRRRRKNDVPDLAKTNKEDS